MKKMMKNDFCILLDAGHGGYNESGKYETAPDKMFKHKPGFKAHRGSYFFEGVWNRNFSERLKKRLAQLNIPCTSVYHPYIDTHLSSRVILANVLSRRYNRSLFISIHSNASPSHQARGFEVFTSPGQTASDTFAELLIRTFQDKMKEWDVPTRRDRTDGDLDKEANFYVLRKTIMPAVLVENLFFDNETDAQLLLNERFCDELAETYCLAIVNYMKSY